MFIVSKYGTSLYIREPKAEHNLVQEWCKSSWSWPVRLCMALKTVVNCS